VFLAIIGRFWSQVGGYGGPWSNCLRSWGGKQNGSCDGVAGHLLLASEMHLSVQ
jgi:hypothetical protein